MRVAEVDVGLRLLEQDDGRLLARTGDIGGHLDRGARPAQMEVVDGGRVVDLERVFAGGSTVVTSAASPVVRWIS